MGVVYEAEDIRLGRRVALKFLPENLSRDPKALQRFEREARAASSLNHPSICTIYEVEEHDHQPVIVMELLQGESLKERLVRGPVPTDELVELGLHTSDALAAAHAKGIVHRDIKPANIFMVGPGRPKILDFGLAKVIGAGIEDQELEEESLTAAGVIPGTTPYMSPEQARGEEIDGRSDLFSLGVVLYEAATGQKPFAKKNRVLTIDAILNAKPAPATALNHALPADFDAIISKALEKDRGRRYQNASEMRSDLQQLKRATESGQVQMAAKAAPPGQTGLSWKLGLAALAAVLAASSAGYFYVHRAPRLTAKDTIVLADFVNTTGDPVFDGTLRQGIAVQLEQSPFLSLVSEERIRQELRLMGQKPDARLTVEIAKEVCERTGSTAVLEGSISNLGSQYVLGLQAKNCRTGDVVDQEQSQASRKEEVLNSLTRIASRFRTRVGESLATVQQHDTPLEDATTPSLEALKAYSTARRVAFTEGYANAIPLLQRAIEIDPKFAMAYAFLSRMAGDVGEFSLSRESARKAYELRDHTSERERFFITLSYHRQVTGNLEKASQTVDSWLQAYPRDQLAHGFLSGFSSQGLGRYEKAIEEGRKAIALDPDFVPGYTNIAIGYMYLNRFAEAENILRQASERKLEIPDFASVRFCIDFLKADGAAMEREAALGRGKSGVQDWMSHAQSLVLARSGQLKKARVELTSAVDLALHAGEQDRAATFEAGGSVWEGLFGNADAARRSATQALKLSKSRDVEYGAAMALLLAGDFSRAQVIANELEQRFPEDTSVQFSYLPALRALAAVKRGNPAAAIEALQIAVPNELGVPGIDFYFAYGGFYPAYARGEAYLASHQGAEAAAEFQKIIGHRGILGFDPLGAVVQLRLAKAYVLAGDSAKAESAYRDFFELWKNADADIPMLKAAQREYEHLK